MVDHDGSHDKCRNVKEACGCKIAQSAPTFLSPLAPASAQKQMASVLCPRSTMPFPSPISLTRLEDDCAVDLYISRIAAWLETQIRAQKWTDDERNLIADLVVISERDTHRANRLAGRLLYFVRASSVRECLRFSRLWRAFPCLRMCSFPPFFVSLLCK